MPMPSVEFLRESPEGLLGSLELSRLNHVANIRKQMLALFDELVDDAAVALLARWMIEHGPELRRMNQSPGQAEFAFPADEQGLTSRYAVLRCPSTQSSLSSIK